ncbi:ATP synthase subunit I [Limnothrix sp. FACHB-881]|nr:ATP synthase subunit I [Limnothrix sp. FACHB-1083]MBD2192860.1 ATP synthase subunit I [Limnothrix sp. FACHB-1088]MBD2553116.1 ATP synthase subunit I [Limnothrix sp. FACHB-708]MBD2592254.1 ATP synthase subunit I [Limnothrix sp. FACHB-406]MBD2634859.1 ATP synthase subunit I [Limnothrix sp. FACHB-881]OCQ95839.1 ATP synthase subunit I [Limnothrix sp. P13C2]PIB14813.1 ATP synthase subunit I [Limnothrix sp. PR1529]
MPEVSPEAIEGTSENGAAMEEYYKLQRELLIGSLVVSLVIFLSVWATYSLNTALSYLLGALVGIVYLRMLAKDVATLGNGKQQLSKTRLALFVAIFLIGARVQQLELLPIILGFLTYKAALIFHTLRAIAKPNP